MNKEELEKLMADIEVAAIETARLRSILNKRVEETATEDEDATRKI